MPVPDELLARETRAKIFQSYLSVASGLLLPAAIGGATWWFNSTQLELNLKQTCIRESLSLSERLVHDDSIAPDRRDQWRQNVATHGNMLAQVCSDVGLKLPPTVLDALVKVEREAESPAVASSARAAVQLAARGQATDRPEAQALAQVTAAAQPRVYFHIASEEQREAARRVEVRLEQTPYGKEQILVPGIQRMTTSANNTLRCFRRKDCDEAPRLLELLNGMLAKPQITLQDMSATYESSPNIRQRHFEVWFAPGPIELKG